MTCAAPVLRRRLQVVLNALPPRDRSLAAAHYARRLPALARLREAIAAVLDRARTETLRRLKAPAVALVKNTAGVTVEIAFPLEDFRGELLATIRDEAARTLQEAGSQLFTELQLPDPFRMPAPRALEFLDLRENLLKDIPDEIHAEITDTIQEGMKGGKNSAQIARDIREKFAEIEGNRADTIASTETAAAYGFARQEGFALAGIGHKRWLTSHLPNVRSAHAAAEDDPRNQRVPVDEPFMVGGEALLYPGDPAGSPENVINCNCIAVPAEEEAA